MAWINRPSAPVNVPWLWLGSEPEGLRILLKVLLKFCGISQSRFDTRLKMKSTITVSFGAVLLLFTVTFGAEAQTRCSTDGFGGQRCVDSSGNVTRITPDGFGGQRYTQPNGDVQHQTPDGFGGSRLTDSHGNTTRITPDGFGGTRITAPDGQVTRCVPDGFGGTRCR
jgi:hypothetical protein